MAGCPGDILRLPAVIISTGHLDTPPHLDSPTEMQVRRFVPHFSPVVIDSSVHSSVYRNESGNVLINYNSPLAVSWPGCARQHETLQISIGNVGRTDGDVCMETMTTHWQEVVLTPHTWSDPGLQSPAPGTLQSAPGHSFAEIRSSIVSCWDNLTR